MLEMKLLCRVPGRKLAARGPIGFTGLFMFAIGNQIQCVVIVSQS